MSTPETPEERRQRLIAETNAWLAKLPPEKRARASERLLSMGLDLMEVAQLHELRRRAAGDQGMIDLIDGQLALIAAGVHHPGGRSP